MQWGVLDEIDLAIVRALRRDARRSVRQLAEEVHISRSSAHTRVRALIDSGVIVGFAAEVELAKLGLPVRAMLAVDTGASPEGSELAAALAAIPHVARVLTIAGEVDYLVEIAAPSHEALSEVVLRRVLKLPGVTSVRTHLVIGETEADPVDDLEPPGRGGGAPPRTGPVPTSPRTGPIPTRSR
ncbi:MAG: Lrp/AsnC family transcriptional regulator [Microbacteriaceae bacterium]|nr:Lrp/AsnC family transcriptional regulator [Microbacteriaceae bacterium]